MPDITLSEAILEAFEHALDVPVYDTLEISHPAFVQPIYVVNDGANLEANLEGGSAVTFVRFKFKFMKPEISATGAAQFTLQMDNVSQEILANIQLAMRYTDPIVTRYRQYLASDLSGPQNNPPLRGVLSNIKVDPFWVRATARFGSASNRRFPTSEYTGSRFPGLLS